MVDQSHSRLVCDGCDRKVEISPRSVVLVPPWREVRLLGFDEDFHACSDRCEARVRARYERPEPELLVESERPPRGDEPTVRETPPPELVEKGRKGHDETEGEG